MDVNRAGERLSVTASRFEIPQRCYVLEMAVRRHERGDVGTLRPLFLPR